MAMTVRPCINVSIAISTTDSVPGSTEEVASGPNLRLPIKLNRR